MALRISPFVSAGCAPSHAMKRSAVVVRCQASNSSPPTASRRKAFLGAAMASPLLFLVSPANALLLPDDDDEDLVNKAKANRQSRLASQKGTTRQFMESEGLKDSNTEAALTAVERAVVKLTQSGAQLEKGDLVAVATMLSEPWVQEFEVASKKVSAGADSLKAVLSGLTSVRDAAVRSDAPAAKKEFVALVAALNNWSDVAGIKSRITGL